MWSVEVIVLAKQEISRRSGCPVIAHRSRGRRQQDLAEDEYVDMERTGTGKYVKEVHKDKRKILAQTRS
jgi:hypothetical protein